MQMPFFSSFARVSELWDKITDSGKRITDPEQRFFAQLLSSLLLTLIPVGLLAYLVRAPLCTSVCKSYDLRLNIIIFALAGYALNLRGRTRLVSMSVVVWSSVTILAYARDGSSQLHILNYLVVVLIFSRLFLSDRLSLLIFAGHIAGMLSMAWLAPNVTAQDLMIGPVSFYVTAVTFILLMNHYRALVMSRRAVQLAASEQALVESESRLKALMESSPVGMLIVSGIEEKLEFASDKFKELFGYSQEDIPDVDHWWPLAYPDETYRERIKTEWAARVRQAVETEGEIEPMETHVTCKDGSVRIVEFRLASVGSKHLITFVDLTERKRVEEALRTSEERHRIISDLIWNYACSYRYLGDDEAHLEWVIGAFEEITGHTIDEALSNFKLSLPVHPDDAQLFSERQRKLRAGEEQVTEFRVVNKQGAVRWVRSHGRPEWDDAHQQVRRVYIGVQDITGQKRAENRFRSLLESAPDAMVIVNQDGSIVLVNSQAVVTFGYNQDELIGKPIETLIPESTHNRHRAQRADYTANPHARGMGIGLDLYAQRKDGSQFPVEISLSPIETEEGGLIASSVRDITERKRIEQRMVELALERERRIILSDFIRDASHEFRTPLSVIHTTAYLLEKTTDPNQSHMRIQRIVEQANNILTLVNDLVEMARLDGVIDLTFISVNINSLLTALCQRAQAEMVSKNIRLHMYLTEPLPLIPANEASLYLGLSKLLANAIRYTPDGGIISIQSQRTDNEIIIEVGDSGIGIKPEDLSHIFERFYRVDEAHTTSGFGLGLPIAQKVVELHGGQIEVESTLGRGSIFRVRLPLLG
jgi:protein-histidine pros-kinase